MEIKIMTKSVIISGVDGTIVEFEHSKKTVKGVHTLALKLLNQASTSVFYVRNGCADGKTTSSNYQIIYRLSGDFIK